MFRSVILFVVLVLLLNIVTGKVSGLPTSKANSAHIKNVLPTAVHGNSASEFAKKYLSSECTGSMTLQGYTFDVCWHNEYIDHFDFVNENNPTFPMRYLINSTWWQAPTAENNFEAGPIFFYTGNEGDITLFATNTGFQWEICPQFNCLIVFAEHRYYGETQPFGKHSYDNGTTLQYLTAEQALADYADFLPALKTSLNAPNAPIISFGGSYGGMLSAWFRIKYPWITLGAIAASAPVLMFEGMVQPTAFSDIISNDFWQTSVGVSCGNAIGKSWQILADYDVNILNQVFKPCQPLQSSNDIQNYLWPYISNAIVSMAMGDYPYPAQFLGDLPAYPVNQTCDLYFQDSMSELQIVEAMGNLVGLFYNSTYINSSYVDIGIGSLQCNPLQGQPSPSPALGTNGWNYQSCTEMVMPIGQYGLNNSPPDIFYPAAWSLPDIITGCQQSFKTTPRPYWIQTEFGGAAISSSSNIVFSNGSLDPWRSGGILESIKDSLPAVFILGGAHHLDLRSSNPMDPESVVEARRGHINYIEAWLQGFGSPKEMQSKKSTIITM